MKYIPIIILFLSVFAVKMAEAVIIVPPVIYIATFSLGTFILNAFMMASVFMAGKGLIDRFYFGKHMHELVGIAFSYVGSMVVIMGASFASIAIFDPIDSRTLFYASIFSTFLSFLVMALGNFRKYLLADPYGRNEAIMRLITFSILVFIITFISAYFSINTSVLRKRVASGPSYADENSENVPLDLSVGLNFTREERSMDLSEKEKPLSSASFAQETIWFNPYKVGQCEIYVSGKYVKSQEPAGKCFYYDRNMNAKRVICPIALDIADLKKIALPMNREMQLEGRGSCLDNYRAYVTDKGFINIQ